MTVNPPDHLAPILYIPHGGGPLPLLGDESHQDMVNFLHTIPSKLGNPSAILVISAHWEGEVAIITAGANPPLIYDYYGFPEEAYRITYPLLGESELAKKIYTLLQKHGIKAKLDGTRGFDHGVFVPLKIMYPDASIPCVQLSLLNNLDPAAHIRIGNALAKLRSENILILGSGFSFHNLPAFFSDHNPNESDPQNEAFQDWLIDTCSGKTLTQRDREERLIQWERAPYARYCHPREEHLLPLHVCFGIAKSPANLVFEDEVMGKKAISFLW